MAERSSTVPVMRRLLLRMMLYVLLLHGVAIGIFYATDMPGQPRGVRTAFTVVWVTATFVIVSLYLRRIRLARKGYTVSGRGRERGKRT